MNHQFKIFLQKSKFPNIQETSTQKGLLKIFGKPNAILGENIENADILRFGNIEFHFFDHSLFLIFSDNFETPKLEENIAEEITHGMKIENFEKVLCENNISYETKNWDFDKRYKVIETEGKVEFYFLEVEPEEFVSEVKGLNYYQSKNL